MAPGIPAPVSTFLYNPLSLSVGRSREIRGKWFWPTNYGKSEGMLLCDYVTLHSEV